MLSMNDLSKIPNKIQARLDEKSEQKAEDFVSSLFGSSQHDNRPKLKTKWDGKNNKST